MTSAPLLTEFYSRFKVFHELMASKIREVLLVSSPYDAYVMEEDGRLASRIINAAYYASSRAFNSSSVNVHNALLMR